MGLFGQGNIGNDCTLHAMLYHVHQYCPDAEIACICTGTDVVNTIYNIQTYPIEAVQETIHANRHGNRRKKISKVLNRVWREIYHVAKGIIFLKNSDVLIVPGTGLLVDHTTGYKGYPYHVIKWAILARLCKCRYQILSIGAGPISHPLSKWFIKCALSLAEYRSFRDANSKRCIESIADKKIDDPIYPDLAFSLQRDLLVKDEAYRSSRPVIGIGVVDYYGHSNKLHLKNDKIYRDYLNKMSIFVKWLLDNGYPVRILIGDVRYDKRVRQDLIDLINCSDKGIRSDSLCVEPNDTLEQLIATLGECDIVISPRYHNLILATMLCKPVIALSHDDKFEALMAGFNLSDFCLSLEEMNIDHLIERLNAAENMVDKIRNRMRSRSNEYRKSLDSQYSIIFSE